MGGAVGNAPGPGRWLREASAGGSTAHGAHPPRARSMAQGVRADARPAKTPRPAPHRWVPPVSRTRRPRLAEAARRLVTVPYLETMSERGVTASAFAKRSRIPKSTARSVARSYLETVACRIPARRASSACDQPFRSRTARRRNPMGLTSTKIRGYTRLRNVTRLRMIPSCPCGCWTAPGV